MTKESTEKHKQELEKLEKESKENQYYSKAYVLFKHFLLVLIAPILAKKYKKSLKEVLQWIKIHYLTFSFHKERQLANRHEIKRLKLALKLFELGKNPYKDKNDNS